MTTPPAPSASEQATTVGCNDCGLSYGSPAWADVVLPDSLWRRISPSGNEGGLLCFNCINARLCALRLRNVPYQIESGPLCFMVRDVKGRTVESAARPAPGTATEHDAAAAMAELWGLFCPDCGPLDYAGIVAHVKEVALGERERARKATEVTREEVERMHQTKEDIARGIALEAGRPIMEAMASAAAAPGDEAAREAARETARRMVTAGGEIDREIGIGPPNGERVHWISVPDHANIPSIVADWRESITAGILSVLARFPRPADSTERESEAVKVLREVEWGARDPLGDPRRPICPACKQAPHAPGCRLAAVLGKGKNNGT